MSKVRYPYINNFQAKPLEERKKESGKILSKYPDRIPVIVDVFADSANNVKLDKNKYLVPTDLTVGQFMYVIRKRCKLAPEKALFLFVDNKLPMANNLMSQLYKSNANEDGFIYITVHEESTFGGV
jgi:GABA(A) receptor-associated protein